MVSKALTILLIWGVIVVALRQWYNPPQPKPHVVEVGRTLAEFRMKRLGITGDWRQYTTARLGII